MPNNRLCVRPRINTNLERTRYHYEIELNLMNTIFSRCNVLISIIQSSWRRFNCCIFICSFVSEKLDSFYEFLVELEILLALFLWLQIKISKKKKKVTRVYFSLSWIFLNFISRTESIYNFPFSIILLEITRRGSFIKLRGQRIGNFLVREEWFVSRIASK